MLSDLHLLNTASALMTHASERQSLVARNIAHADTPGFKALDLAAFADVYRTRNEVFSQALTHRDLETRRDFLTRHMTEIAPRGEVSPDGNTVGLEDQMIRGQEAARAHRRAITIYRHSVDQLRTALGR
jgi:flagellar basal-body rod protein FlgB